MNDQQKYLVQSSFEQVVPVADTATCLFCYRLLDLDPSMRSLFPADLTDGSRKLMELLTLAVDSLDRLDQLILIAEGLGRRHPWAGMRLEQYDAAATALRWTLEQVLGDAFTSDVEDAWLAAYTLLAAVMQNAANPELEKVTA